MKTHSFSSKQNEFHPHSTTAAINYQQIVSSLPPPVRIGITTTSSIRNHIKNTTTVNVKTTPILPNFKSKHLEIESDNTGILGYENQDMPGKEGTQEIEIASSCSVL